MNDCIFCRIISGEAPAEIVYSDELATAFHDIHPVAATHILIVPNQHIASVNDLREDDELRIGHLFTIAQQLAHNHGIHESGYRIIVNTGRNAGQAVFHIHLHLIGGQRMRYPMG